MAILKHKLKHFGHRFLRDTSGHIAVGTAIVGLPLILLVGGSLDMNKSVGKKVAISAALDAAALASVIPDNLSTDERVQYAKDVFDTNYVGDVPVTLQVNATRERVEISGSAQIPSLFGGVVGMSNIGVSANATAVLTKSDVVCVLALDPIGERSLEFSDSAVFNSPACSVQVNSTNHLAVVSDVVTPPIAKSFCTSGISRGNFTPIIKHACSPVADPYQHLQPPADDPCQTAQKINNGVTVLYPGTYCNGLSIQNGSVQFEPGTYVIKNKRLEFRKGVIATGKGVTFVLKEGANLEIEKDAQVSLTAPDTGPYAGLAFYQAYEKSIGKAPSFPNGTNTIVSGGGLTIVGTAYFPTQELLITSDSPVVSQSPATSFIAYRIKFGGKSNTQIHVDHEKGGIPPLLPRSDDGARLVD